MLTFVKAALGPRLWAALLVIVFGLMGAQSATAQSNGTNRVSVHLVVGVDVSADSPYVSDRSLARKTARRIRKAIEDLPMRAVISFRTFGGHSTSENTVSVDRQVSRSRPAKDMGELFETLITGVPQLVQKGKLTPHKESNIVGFMRSMARTVKCGEHPTIFVLATDGLEDSEVARIAKGDSLPKPRDAMFDGCSRLEMLGLGQGGGSLSLTERVIEEWRGWSKAAGFRSYVGLDTW